MTPMLTADGVSAKYEASLEEVIHDVSFEISEGEIVSLIGPNGAGKSTSMRVLTGLLPPTAGTITFRGEDITDDGPNEIVEKGISLVPEGRELFPGMTVLENLEVAADRIGDGHYEDVYDLFPVLEDRSNQRAGSLSGGEQQMLAIAQALITDPDLLLLDEPSLGLAPQLVDEVFAVIDSLVEEGVTVFLVEQQARRALETADRASVMREGRIAFEGPAREILEREDLSEAYLQ